MEGNGLAPGLLVACAMMISGCYSPAAVADCVYKCGGSACPLGQSCDNEGFCRVDGYFGSCLAVDADIDADTCLNNTVHMMVLQDPADPTPAGWICVSCTASDDMFERFVVGASAFGGRGGSVDHAHALTFTTGAPSATTDVANGSVGLATSNHTHASPSAMTSTVNHLPPFRDLKVIRPMTPTLSLPIGAIVMLDGPEPSASFAPYAAQLGYFIRAGGTPTTGGTASHIHTFMATLGSSSAATNALADTTAADAARPHTHTLSGSTGSVPNNNEPNHANIVLARVVATTDLVSGVIAMFDAPPVNPWQVLSGSGGLLEGDFLKAATAPDFNALGSSTHFHTQVLVSTAGPSATQLVNSGGTSVAAADHMHSVTVSFGTADIRPPYIETIFAKLSQTACQ